MQRAQFYSEECFATLATGGKKWTMFDAAGEVMRLKKNSQHVANPQLPESVYGYSISQIDEYVKTLSKYAGGKTETYRRKGKDHVRAVKANTPTLLIAIASYPEPEMADTIERKRWVQLVVDAFRARFGKRFRCGVMHQDEAFAHLHLFVDNVGVSVKPLHYGHAAAAAEPVSSKKGEAYRRGCSAVQDWYHGAVGAAMGWVRSAPRPRTRTDRSTAMRERQREQEETAIKQSKKIKRVNEEIEKVLLCKKKNNDERLLLEKMKRELNEESIRLANLREAICDQKSLEDRLRYEEVHGAQNTFSIFD